MDAYLTSLFASELALAPWTVALAWIALFAGNHAVVRHANRALQSQQSVVPAEPSLLARGAGSRNLIAQLLLAAAVLGVAVAMGEPYYALFAGGLLVTVAVTLGLNYHSLMFARALGRAGSAQGRVELSTAFSLGSSGHRLLGAALASLVLGLALASLPLLGGALFLGSTGLGRLRRAARRVAHPAGTR